MKIRAKSIYSLLSPTFVLVLALVILSGCAYDPYAVNEGIPMDEWCGQDNSMPWAGCRKEINQIDCQSGEVFESEDTIGEFRLRADGIYSVTRHPFEHWVDYSGTYTVTETNSTITFSPIDTPGFDGEGTYLIREDGDLVLYDIWFGVYDESSDTDLDSDVVSCGYEFR